MCSLKYWATQLSILHLSVVISASKKKMEINNLFPIKAFFLQISYKQPTVETNIHLLIFKTMQALQYIQEQ